MFRALQTPSTKVLLLALMIVLVCGYVAPWWVLSARVRAMSDLRTAIHENAGDDEMVSYRGRIPTDDAACSGTVDAFLYASERPMEAIDASFSDMLARLGWERTSSPAHAFAREGDIWRNVYPYPVLWGYHYEVSVIPAEPDGQSELLAAFAPALEPLRETGQTLYVIEIFSHWGAGCLPEAE